MGLSSSLLVFRFSNLLRLANNNFSAAIVDRNGSANLQPPAGQSAEVAELTAVRREDNAGEGALTVIRAEVQESIAAA